MRNYILFFLLIAFGFPAHAVFLSEDQGQVVIFPYFSTNQQNTTEINVFNTKTAKKALKVLFFEKDNGTKVYDMNAYVNGHGTLDLTLTYDSKKNVTVIKSQNKIRIQGSKALANISSREGFIEVIEMGEVSGDKIPKKSADLLAPTGGLVAAEKITQKTPMNIQISLEPTLLDGFMDKAFYSDAGSDHPNLSDVSPKISYVYTSKGVQTSHWSKPGHSPVDPVSAVLMAKSAINLFQINAGAAAQTNVVFTLPTKSFYPSFANSKKCFQANLQINNDSFSELATKTNQGICSSLSVLGFNQANILLSKNLINLKTQMPNGILSADFTQNNLNLVSDEKDIYQGAPVVSFNVIEMHMGNAIAASASKAKIKR